MLSPQVLFGQGPICVLSLLRRAKTTAEHHYVQRPVSAYFTASVTVLSPSLRNFPRTSDTELMRWIAPTRPHRYLDGRIFRLVERHPSMTSKNQYFGDSTWQKGSFQVCAFGPLMERLSSTALLSRTPAGPRFGRRSRPVLLAMGACATSHHWGRFAQSHGHEVTACARLLT